jgi:hypothetical protein
MAFHRNGVFPTPWWGDKERQRWVAKTRPVYTPKYFYKEQRIRVS